MLLSLSPRKVDFDKVWGNLSKAVENVISLQNVTGMPMMEDVYALCTSQPKPYSEELYVQLKKLLENHVSQIYEQLSLSSNILGDYLKRWETYSAGCEYCSAIFRYLNMNWITKQMKETRRPTGSSSSIREVFEVYTLSLVVWREKLFLKIKDRILNAVNELVTRERDGEQISHSELSGIVSSFVKLGSVNRNKPLENYREHFEGPYLRCLEEYYARESDEYKNTNGISAYLVKAEKRLTEESERSKKFLDTSSWEKVKKESENVLVGKHKDSILSEFELYLREVKQDDLARTYRLIGCLGDLGMKSLLEGLHKYVVDYGFQQVKAIPVKEQSDAKTYIECLLACYSHFVGIIKTCFHNDSTFLNTLDKACRVVVNENSINDKGPKSSEYLAKYADVLLKKGGKNLEAAELDEKLSQLITIFKYLDDKDVFQKFYSKLLARRLINENSVSDDAESAMISGLKQACGFEYTTKLQRMFTDMTISTDINEKFKAFLEKEKGDVGKMDFVMLVLTAGSWPLQTQTANFVIPQDLEKCIHQFTKFYNHQHQGRKLSWLHHLSKGEVKSVCMKKKYEFAVTTFQMAILLQFNDNPLQTMASLADATTLKTSELERTVKSLVESNVLKESSEGFTVNVDYSNKRLKLKLTTAVQRETKEENQDTHKSIDDDRKLYIQAAIVRIMKARKQLTHVNLVQEVIDQAKSRFSPHIPMIKKCVEFLIEKEYLQRIEGESDKYQYLA